MTQFRERNPVPIGIAGIVAVLVVVGLAFSATKFPFVPGGGGHKIHAYFTDASSLGKNDDVRMAGIKVGKVTNVSLVMTQDSKGQTVQAVDVTMQVDKDVHLPADTQADIKIKTLLGAMYVSLNPVDDGNGGLHGAIPLTRTTTPTIVTAAFQSLASTVDQIDTNQLSQAFTVLSQAFQDTGPETSSTLKGLAAVSQTISSRDVELKQLLEHAQGVTTALASRDAQITKLINDGQTVLTLVNQQRDVIHQLLVDTVTLSQQLTAFVNENRAILKPALTNLQATIDILSKEQTNLDQSIHLLAPFLRDFANTLGNGKWFDNVVTNLTDVASGQCFGSAATAQPNQSSGAGCS